VFFCNILRMFGLADITTAGDVAALPLNQDQFNRMLVVAERALPLLAAFDIVYPLEFLLVTNVKLLVIHRLY